MFSASKSGQYPGYLISRSVRLRSSASAYFNRTPASASNRKTWTWSDWIKRGSLANYVLFNAGVASTQFSGVQFTSTGQIEVFEFSGAGFGFQLTTTAVYRDPSAWYHIVVAFDTTQATASNRIKLYVNGVQITAFATANYPTLNADYPINNNVNHEIGRSAYNSTQLADCYLAEVNFIDGQALTPSSFGQYNAYGVWSPTKYNGTYGTNGFYLNFSDNSAATAAAIGKDYSGNGNNWTPNNISVTAGVTYDSMLDVPTQWADGGNGRGNYAVLNPLSNGYVTTPIISITDGNLNFSDATSTSKTCVGSMTAPSGKWYFEMTCTNTGVYYVGLIDKATNNESWYRNNGTYSSSFGGGGTSGYSSWTTNDVIGVAWDVDAGKIWFAKNNTWQSGSPSASTSPTNTFTAGLSLLPEIYTDNSAGTKSGSFNFGQRPFSYTPPSGFKALNTLNLPTPTIANGALYMAASIYTGTGANLSITNTVNNVSFQPDLVWIKSRSNALDHKLTDSVRGTTKALISNTTGAETTDTTGLTAFNSNGFTVGTGTQYNANASVTYVGWQWNAGGSTVTNTSGSISAQVRASTTAGFSIVTYTGTGANATVGHGLGVAPRMIIFRARSIVENWPTWHTNLTSAAYVLTLNTTNAQASVPQVMNSTAPTSSVFSVGTSTGSNGSGTTYVAYCFAPIAGYSAFGSYTGNGSADGPFVFCGFRPRYFMMKRTDAGAESWFIYDTARSTFNTSTRMLAADLSSAELDNAAYAFDFLANGIKIRNANTYLNASGGTYIFAAFAENPFKYSLAR